VLIVADGDRLLEEQRKATLEKVRKAQQQLLERMKIKNVNVDFQGKIACPDDGNSFYFN
jgi:hypothetical protein